MNTTYQNYLNSEDWLLKRITKFNKSKTKCCAVCGSRERLEVHHLFYRSDLKEAENTDLRIFCRICHETAHELIKLGVIKFKNKNHHSRFAITRNALVKYLSLYDSGINNVKPELGTSDMVTVTKEMLNYAKSKNGGYSSKQIKAIMPYAATKRGKVLDKEVFVKGWKGRMVGTEVPRETISQFINLKNKHLK